MYRSVVFSAIGWFAMAGLSYAATPLRGTYVEARTCQVYTGPCFANGEVGSVGKDAIMTWQITSGTFNGVNLDGQAVAVVVKTSDTLGFKGLENAEKTQAIVIIDSSASDVQSQALAAFALKQTGIRPVDVKATYNRDIEMRFDPAKLTASVDVNGIAKLETRKARPGDCICSNESAYYPPLTQLKGFVPGVTIDGEVSARRLGMRWSIPDSRTAYLGTFEVAASGIDSQLAKAP